MKEYFDKNGIPPFSFYRMPKALFTETEYREMSADAKLLYMLLLDRMNLSLQNGWIDQDGRAYQFFTVKQVQEILNFGHEKVCRLFQELQRFGLIDRRRQGLGKSNIIRLRKFF